MKLASRTTYLVATLFVTTFATNTRAATFTKVTSGPVVTDGGNSRSVNFIDANGDGYPDIFVANGRPTAPVDPANFLYMNNGDGTFTKITTDTIVTTKASSDGTSWSDIDNDGDLDCYVATWFGQNNLLFRNNGAGNFTREVGTPIVADTVWSDCAAWADYDRDGRIDLLYSAGFSTPLVKALFHNDGVSGFSKVVSTPLTTDGDRSHGIGWSDYDNDGDLDVFVTNINQNNALYRNDGASGFVRIAAAPFTTDVGISIRCAWGDIDNDLDQDLFVTNTNGQNDYEYLNNGNGTFTKVTLGPQVTDGAWSNSVGLVDVDNDADLDLFVTVGFQLGQLTNRLYYNDGAGKFTRELSGSVVNDSGWTHGFAFGDVERDGDLDLVCARNLNENQNNALYLNDGNSNHWLDISCVGVGSPRDGNGTRVLVHATINGTPGWQMRELCSPTGFGQNGLSAHFGLKDAGAADTVVVKWSAGTTDYYFNISGDQFLTLSECPDPDGDKIGCGDNCPDTPNPGQTDVNHDGIGDACCCAGVTGNVDCDPGNGVDISDLSSLIDYLYITFSPLCCSGEANVDGQPGTDISDLSALIDYLYISFTLPTPCQ